MKRKIWTLSAIGFFLLVCGSVVAWVGICPTLPTGQVTPSWLYPAVATNSTFDTWINGILEPSDVENGVVYPGWCLEQHVPTPGGLQVTLYCSMTPPSDLSGIQWNKINYILNNKQGDWMSIQQAIWLIAEGYTDYWGPPSADALAMEADANMNGGTFVPGPGQVIAVILYSGDGGLMGAGNGLQETLIEVLIPSDGGYGCTPGFWRNHYEAWTAPYDPTDSFNDTFGVMVFDQSYTLGDAIWAGGGGQHKIARHGTAALLNAAHPDIDYPFTVEQVISAVQAAFLGDKDAINALAFANERTCPIDR